MWNLLKKLWAVLNADVWRGDVLENLGIEVYYKRPIRSVGEVGWDERFTK